ncbi:hypothetical protein BDR05DRAFT_945360 [Suillus weaverae]|nr:hypothetical protein BDR05DRAFT_945360 [Suillus weaverae]
MIYSMFQTYLWDAHSRSRSVIAWQQYVQGTIFTLLVARMSCALGSDGQLKDTSTIDWYNDPDDGTPMPAPHLLPASNGTLTTFVSRCSEKICKATNAAPTKRSAPVPPQSQPAPVTLSVFCSSSASEGALGQACSITPKRVQTGSHLVCHHNDNDNDEPPVLEDFTNDEEEDKVKVNKEEAYQKTKVFGDEDREDCKHKMKEERSGDLKVVCTQEKGHINPHTQEHEDGWWCEICRHSNSLTRDPFIGCFNTSGLPFQTRIFLIAQKLEMKFLNGRSLPFNIPWAKGRNILDYDGWAWSEIIPDGDGWAKVVGYYVDGCMPRVLVITYTGGPRYGWANILVSFCRQMGGLREQ